MSVVVSFSIPIALIIATALDTLFAEPPARLHPIVFLGRVIEPVDGTYDRPLLVGTLAAVCIPIGFAAVLGGIVYLVGVVVPQVAPVVAGVLLFTLFSQRMLLDTARSVITATADDLETARHDLRALAGRDAAGLSPEQIRSAATESVAENLADGLVGPLGAFTIGALSVTVLGASVFASAVPTSPAVALAVGIAAASWVKAVNTMDSMIGYRSKRVGTPSARLDDLVMWIPARISACFISLAVPSPDPLLSARRWAQNPPSPNSGWPMATLAGALHVKLEKPGVYTLNELASLPTVSEALRGVQVVSRAGRLFILICVLAGVAIGGT
ncbi:cobalamin biosynthesis protein CobD [Halorubraceae archaeon YAN]|nr:cobalamin biosynthesis protein CobD [Halorubraceae archaeon YAN]